MGPNKSWQLDWANIAIVFGSLSAFYGVTLLLRLG